jgi:crotonobetaine/carnitine-CoA ligase
VTWTPFVDDARSGRRSGAHLTARDADSASRHSSEDDLKMTAVKEGASLTEEELFRWCIDELRHFALPRYVSSGPSCRRSPVGRVLKRDLRAEGVTPATWDSEAAGVAYDKR